MAELLFWPALLAYGEAAFAYFGEARAPGLPGRLATWGVRIGWLAQTALLVAQAARADGFPWATWAGSLNLFVWLVVTAYLDLGLPRALPAARARGHAARRRAVRRRAARRRHGARRRAATTRTSSSSSTSGSCSPRSRASRSPPGSPRSTCSRSGGSSGTTPASCACPAPALADAGRARRRGRSRSRLPALTLGMVVGLVRLEENGGGLDALMAVTLATWLAYGVVPRAALRVRLAGPAHRIPRARRVRARHRRPARAPRDPLRMRLSLVGISHRHAPVEVRERVALDAQAVGRARARARGGRRRVRLPLDVQPHRAVRRRRRRGGALRSRRCARSAATRSRRCRTGSPITRRRCISSASPPGSTRSCPARARSSARFARRTRPARPGRC